MTTDPLKIAIKGSTQDHLPIEDIVDGVVIMKDGSCASIMQISSVNFDLLSEKEQSALVAAYGGILNSLNFPIQIVVKSSTKDVGVYLKRLLEAEKKQTNKLLKERIKNYRKFIDETVKKNDVLSKTFYIVIKFSSLELGIKTAGVQTITNLFNKKVTSLPYPKAEILEKAKASLEPKRDHLVRLFSRLGLEIIPLTNRQSIELFYKIYNEEVATNQKMETINYQNPIVTTK
ncbi:MAG TPA: hypothetical protein PKZ92_01905 [Candidatus Woesebacteria bacterium]|jgi:hypothetical protein|nr:hypothetical protein [Candidatus Shapirobacteria bacterium]HOR01991.1 hypothetical protein [Candidatus Woesebacteria bacterium]